MQVLGTALLLLSASLCPLAPMAHAHPPHALRSPLLRLVARPMRALLAETPEWVALETRRNQIRHAGGGALVDLFDQEVMTQLREIDDWISIQRRRAEAEGRSAAEIAIAESVWIDALAGTRLRMVDQLADLRVGIDEFLAIEASDFVGLRRAGIRPPATSAARFLRPTENVATYSPALYTGALHEAASARREVQTWIERLDDCTRSAPATEMAERQNYFFATDIAISLGVTTLGFITGAGEREVQWWTLPIDLLLMVADRFVSSRIAFRDQPFRIRWMQGVALGEGRAGVDFMLYSIVPSSLDDHWGHHPERAPEATARFAWASMWTAGMSLPTMGINTLLGGWECLSPAPSTRAAITFLRFGNSLLRSYASYRGRSEFYDHVLTEH